MKIEFLSALTAFLAVASAATTPAYTKSGPKTCKKPTKRIEWRKLSSKDQQGYFKAVKCLKTKPSRRGLDTSLFDDFAYTHFELNTYIHGGSPFLPWHRYFSKVHEDALRECGYTGPGTYWDWTKDWESLLNSPVMSPKTGFGGNGSPSRTEFSQDGSTIRCVENGPFKNFRPSYLGISPVDITEGGHCLWRNLPEVSEPQAWATMQGSITPEGVSKVQASKNWDKYHTALEGGPHGTIHASLGGDMNPTTSPNEPLFFLHHAQIDRLWWQWQQKNSSRLTEYYGEHAHFGETGSRQVKLSDILPMSGIARDVTVADVMDTNSKTLCFTYE